LRRLTVLKKVLIITYYWPPSGGPGVQRWLKFVKYLPQFGWEPTVLTTLDGDYPIIDESLLKDVPQNIRIIRSTTPTFGKMYKSIVGKETSIPYGSLKTDRRDSFLKKVFIFVRLNLIIPDARKIWNKYAFKAAQKEILSHKYHLIITTGPPHSTHLIGLKLKKRYALKWIADFRDPWTEMGYIKSANRWRLTSYFDKIFEKKVVINCDRLLAVSEKIINDLGNDKKIILLRNGYDHQDFKNLTPNSEKEYFAINYFGSIAPESNPMPILKAINRMDEKKKIRVNFWGIIEGKIKNDLEIADINNLITFNNYLSHSEMLNYLVNSSLLFLVINKVKNNRGIITGKIFEYIGSRIPIIGIGPEDGEAAKILEDTDSGKMFSYERIEDIKCYIQNKYNEWKTDKYHLRNGNYKKYSRIQLTQKSVKIFEKTCFPKNI